jgi:hypothetical protein
MRTFILLITLCIFINTNSRAQPSGFYITTEDGRPMNRVNIALVGNYGHFPLQPQSVINGFYNPVISNNIPIGANAEIIASSNTSPKNGVTTYDLLLISRHILGLEPMNSPYKMIAADANKSNTITTFDIVELRKIILGVYSELPNNTSWRFISTNQIFSNPQNPFTNTIHESVSLTSLFQSLGDTLFFGVKIGDINLSADADSLLAGDDRTDNQLVIQVEANQTNVQPGDIIEVAITPEQVLIHQYTLQLNGFQILDLRPVSDDLTMDNFAQFSDPADPRNSRLTASIMDSEGAYTLQLKAQRAGRVADMLYTTHDITRSEAYYDTGERLGIALKSKQNEGEFMEFSVYPNTPNSWSTQTNIHFDLPTDDHVTLQVFNLNGQLLYSKEGDYSKGYNNISIDALQLGNASGQLIYTISNSTHTRTRSMTRL